MKNRRNACIFKLCPIKKKEKTPNSKTIKFCKL